jgi:hypothetical protein
MTQIRKRGTPAVLICSIPFAGLAQGQARVDGVPDLPLVKIDHPLGGIVHASVLERVEQAVPQLIAQLRALNV